MAKKGKKVFGGSSRPRVSVFRSLNHIYAQVIDDTTGQTILSVSSLKTKSGGNIAAAKLVGKQLAEKAKAAGISKVVFDRGAFRYHGRIKTLADAAREGGLIF